GRKGIGVLLTVSRVAVFGGTHGNELSGVYLVREKKVEEDGHVSVMSNPRAVQQCQRYMETDLNRCFTLSPEATDLVCDLHNTTANLGLSRIANSDCD
ncbi:unnamed protein product, partial [Coregonus sp. 'balchen']